MLRHTLSCPIALCIGSCGLARLILFTQFCSRQPESPVQEFCGMISDILMLYFQFGCCGVGNDGYKDWEMNVYFNSSSDNPSGERGAVPFSCCRTPNNLEVSRLCCTFLAAKITRVDWHLICNSFAALEFLKCTVPLAHTLC